jgi:hypothetical protein
MRQQPVPRPDGTVAVPVPPSASPAALRCCHHSEYHLYHISPTPVLMLTAHRL